MSRPPRRYVKHTKIAEWWAERGLLADGYWPACMGCGEGVEDWPKLERAHLVDRWRDGLDHEPNLVLLCHGCHKVMPSFGPEEAESAIQWVKDRPHWEGLWLTYTATKVLTDPAGVKRRMGRSLSESEWAEMRRWAISTLESSGERQSA